jgi:ATP-binding cassette subfamily C (CFTR/MRP) protein 1
LSASFFIDAILVGIALQRMGDISVRLGIKIRAALMTAVYRKSFKLTSLNSEDSEGGNVVSMVATDCSKLYEGVQHCQNVWTAPLEAGAIIGLLLSLTGVYGLPALGVVLIVLPLQYFFGYKIASYKMQSVQVADARVLRMHEILLAIKLVKFYVWEKSFAKQVEDVSNTTPSFGPGNSYVPMQWQPCASADHADVRVRDLVPGLWVRGPVPGLTVQHKAVL